MKLTFKHKSILTLMLECFTSHPQSHGMSYWQHLKFAWGVAAQLVMSVTVFGLHGIVPPFKIPKSLDFEATIDYLECRNKRVDRQPEVDISGVRVSS